MEDEDYDGEGDTTFEYSFDFLKRYKPKAIKIDTTYDDMDLHIESLQNILNCKSVEKIKFGIHNTPTKFFKQIIKCKPLPAIKSLQVRLLPYYGDRKEEDEDEDEDIDGKLIGKLFKDCEISNYTTLKKLILLQGIMYPNEKRDPSCLLGSLIGNITLTTLGLNIFKHWNVRLQNSQDDILILSSKLSSLIKIPKITTLHCEFNSLIPFLQHCNENPNIKTLMVTKGPRISMFCRGYLSYFYDDEIQFISNFFKQNKSLQKFGIKKKYFKQLDNNENVYGSNIEIHYINAKF